MKRKLYKAPVAVPTKKYNYYVENFDEMAPKPSKKSEETTTSVFSTKPVTNTEPI